jgi:hypothetical protein
MPNNCRFNLADKQATKEPIRLSERAVSPPQAVDAVDRGS